MKGLTQLHPDVPEEQRGTYAGLAHPAVIEHLQKLGITAIELMPVHQFVNDSTLLEKGLRNYWGYNTDRLLRAAQRVRLDRRARPAGAGVQGMVRALHDAGIEVILDVVYNHTAEGNHLGPDARVPRHRQRRVLPARRGRPAVLHGLHGHRQLAQRRHPHALQLIMDSLRYWVLDMHVDGFRFDLASTLAREFYDVDQLSTFFELVQQDPVVSQVKLIAEPWDVGPGGYQVGNFPPQWTEWNGKYRDTVRDFWRGEPATLGEFASRITGSADLYENTGRRPVASINFVTAHDGFTLRDLVSYNEKHNEANGEDSNDGESHNRSWNSGVEGDDRRPDVLTLRARQQRNFLATLLLSQGVPMLLHGDELGRTQHGNNNALRPGLRAQLGALGRGRPAAHRVHRRARAAAQGASDVPAQPLLRRPPGARERGPSRCPTSCGCGPTARRCSRRTGTPARARDRRVPQRPGHPRRDTRGERIIDATSCCSSTPSPSTRRSRCRCARDQHVGHPDRHRRAASRTASRIAGERRSRSRRSR